MGRDERGSNNRWDVNQWTFHGAFTLKTINTTLSDSKMPPFVKGNHWLVGSFGRGRLQMEESGHHSLHDTSCWSRANCAPYSVRAQPWGGGVRAALVGALPAGIGKVVSILTTSL